MEDLPQEGDLGTESLDGAAEKKFRKCPVCKGEGFLREKLKRTYIVYRLVPCTSCVGSGKVSH